MVSLQKTHPMERKSKCKKCPGRAAEIENESWNEARALGTGSPVTETVSVCGPLKSWTDAWVRG